MALSLTKCSIRLLAKAVAETKPLATICAGTSAVYAASGVRVSGMGTTFAAGSGTLAVANFSANGYTGKGTVTISGSTATVPFDHFLILSENFLRMYPIWRDAKVALICSLDPKVAELLPTKLEDYPDFLKFVLPNKFLVGPLSELACLDIVQNDLESLKEFSAGYYNSIASLLSAADDYTHSVILVLMRLELGYLQFCYKREGEIDLIAKTMQDDILRVFEAARRHRQVVEKIRHRVDELHVFVPV